MRSFPQNQSQQFKSVLGLAGAVAGGILILSSVFVVPAGKVGVVTTLGKVAKNPTHPWPEY